MGDSYFSSTDGVRSIAGKTAADWSPIAIARNSILTEVVPDSLLVETSGLELKRLLDFLTRIEVRGRLLKIMSQEDLETKLKGCVQERCKSQWHEITKRI